MFRAHPHTPIRVPYGDWRLDGSLSPHCVQQATALPTLDDNTAMNLAHLLTQQEQRFGVNMFDALRPQDEPEVQSLISRGYTNEQAVLHVFERCYAHHSPHTHQHSAAHTHHTKSGHSLSRSGGEVAAAPRTVAVSVVTASTPVATGEQSKEPLKKSSFQNLLSGIAHAFRGGHASDSDDSISDAECEEAYAKLRYNRSDVRVLRDMGYNREQAVTALLQCNNNVPLAIEALCNT
jgi:hypothetical protein